MTETVLYAVAAPSPYALWPWYLLAGLLALLIVYVAAGTPWITHGDWYRTSPARPTWLLALAAPLTVMAIGLVITDERADRFADLAAGRYEVTEGRVTAVRGGQDGANNVHGKVRRGTILNLTHLEVEGRPFRLGREAGGPRIRYTDPANLPIKLGDQVRIKHRNARIYEVVRLDQDSDT